MRILETITGYDNAVKAVAGWAKAWNDSNGAGRMIANKLSAFDQEGSGEFYEAVCLNLDEAESCATEIYQIETCW